MRNLKNTPQKEVEETTENKIYKDLKMYKIISVVALVIVVITSFTNLVYQKYIDKMMHKYGEIEFVSDNIVRGFYKDTAEEDLQKIVIKNIVDSLGDVYTTYHDKDQFDNILGRLKGENIGLGLIIKEIGEQYIIDYVYKGSPAYKVGILRGDRLISINENILEGKKLNPIDLINNEKGSKIDIKLARASEELTVTVVVGEYNIDTVETTKFEDTGYINILQFTEKTDREFEKGIKRLKGISSLVIDVRGNPGGSVSTTVNILGMLGIDGEVATLRGARDEVVYKIKPNNIFGDIPIVILADENSASSSEIFIHALRHYKGSKIVGVNTYGKALAQNVMINRKTGTGLILTVFEVILPGNTETEISGIQPDIHVEQTGDYYFKEGKKEKDIQLEKALEILNELVK